MLSPDELRRLNISELVALEKMIAVVITEKLRNTEHGSAPAELRLKQKPVVPEMGGAR